MTPVPASKRHLSHLEHALFSSKKPRVEPCPISFSTMSDQAVVGAPVPIDLAFDELAHDFINSSAIPTHSKDTSFDPLFDDTSLDILPLQETSDVSSDESKNERNNQQDKIAFSARSTTGEPQEKNLVSSRHPFPAKDEDSLKKRQAERAARNRESSRRAREKQKSRFRALESGYLALQETVQRYKLQNEHLQSLIDRARLVQQSCPVCSYNCTLLPHVARQDSAHS